MTKRRNKYYIIAAIAAVALISFTSINGFWPKKPFADLKQEDVVSAKISFETYPTYQITKADQEKLISLLRTITVTKKSEAYKQLDAKSYGDIFILHLSTNKDITVEPFSPYLIIDGTGYQSNDKDTFNTMSYIYSSYIDVIKQTTSPTGSN